MSAERVSASERLIFRFLREAPFLPNAGRLGTLTSAVQPNRVQQILYGQSLEPYICADLIGKTLVDKTATAAQIIVTDHPAALDLRLRVEVPVAFVDLNAATTALSPHAHFPNDALTLRALNDRLGNFDFAEPFTRIREAIAEARKLGVAGRS